MSLGTSLLIKYFGLIFIIASLMRLCLYKNRKDELKALNVPNNCDILIILFEFMVGIILIFDIYDKKNTLIMLLIFILFGTMLILINNFDKILNEFFDVFTYQPSMQSVAFHFIYMVIIIAIILNLNCESSKLNNNMI